DDEKRPAGAAGDHVFSNRASVEQRHGQEKHETQKQHTAARFYRLIEGGGRIDQHGANRGSSCNRKDMLRRVDQTPHFGVPAVADDDVKGLQNDGKHYPVNQHELKGTGKELVATNVTHNPINDDPAKDVADQVEQPDNPIVTANSIKRSSGFLIGAAQGGRR